MSRSSAAPRAAVATIATLALACARAPSWPPSPAAFHPGEEACAECRMFVSDARFAVQWHVRPGDVQWFDDLGCLLGHGCAPAPEAVFVRDFERDAWVRGDQGHAVLVAGLDSPMGYGWSVHASPNGAHAAARAEGAQIVALSELLLRGSPVAQRQLEDPPVPSNLREDRR